MAWGQMQEVVLVEVGEPDLDGARAPGNPPAGPLPGGRDPERAAVLRRLRRWWPVTAGLVALVAAGIVTSGVRERDRAARLEALPGLLSPLDPGVREIWRVPQRGWSQFDAVGNNVLLFGPDDQGVVAVVSVDRSTGEQRWTAPLPEVSATGDVWCVALGDAGGGAARLACRVVIASVVDVQNGNYRPVEPVLLVVLDARTGERVAERPLDSHSVGLAPFGRDLVVTQVLADSTAEVRRQDPVTGETRWVFRSERPLGDVGGDNLWLSPSVQHGVIVANGPVTWALAADGTVLGEWHLKGGDRAASGGWWLDVSALPDGRFAVGESGGVSGSDDDYGTVSTTDARDGFAIPGPVLEPAVDDGSAEGILLTSSRNGSGLVALDARSGERLWRSEHAVEGGAILLDGRLIAMDGNELTALDARSGRPLWTVDIPMAGRARQVFTDGRVVVVPRSDPGRGTVLTAYDPADGRWRWSAPVPARLDYLAVVDGRLFAMTDHDLIALG